MRSEQWLDHKVDELPAGGAFCSRCPAWRGCLGQEPAVEMYIAHLMQVMAALWRVLRDDGTCWINLDDTRQSGSHNGYDGGPKQATNAGAATVQPKGGLRQKDMALVPERFILAAQAQGWYVRSKPVWAPLNPMPESAPDRPTDAYQMLYCLAKTARAQFWTHRELAGVRRRPKADYRWQKVKPVEIGNHKYDGTGLRLADGFNDRWDAKEAAEGESVVLEERTTPPPGWTPKSKGEWRRVNLWRGHSVWWDSVAIAEPIASVTANPVKYIHEDVYGLQARITPKRFLSTEKQEQSKLTMQDLYQETGTSPKADGAGADALSSSEEKIRPNREGAKESPEICRIGTPENIPGELLAERSREIKSAQSQYLTESEGTGPPVLAIRQGQGANQMATGTSVRNDNDGSMVRTEENPQIPLRLLSAEEAFNDGPYNSNFTRRDAYHTECPPGVSELQQQEAYKDTAGRNLSPVRHPRNVQTWPTEGLGSFRVKGKTLTHFAAFPKSLPLWAIRASCPATCCGRCGAGYARLIEKQASPHDGVTSTAYNTKKDSAGRLAMLRQASRERGGEYANQTRTLGWSPTCQCPQDLPTIPGIVMDPFLGSGTTALAAQQLGRRCWGIELAKDYIDLSIHRLSITQPGLVTGLEGEEPSSIVCVQGCDTGDRPLLDSQLHLRLSAEQRNE